MSSITIECQVCCEEAKSSVYCGSCSYTSCQACFQKYLLTVPSARCMNCKAAFTEHFLRMYLPHNWIERKYKPHLKEQLFQQEKSKLSGDVELAQLYKELDEVRYNKRLSKTCASLAQFNYDHLIKSLEKRIISLQNATLFSNSSTTIVSKFKRPCNQPDCRGFLNDEWCCGICKTSICKDCRVAKKPLYSHKCDPETIKSVELINKETKPCPTCSEPIFKPFGCDHMFCTVCKSSFSWKTGSLISESKQTNPLYKEYLKKLGAKGGCDANDTTTLERFKRLSCALFSSIRIVDNGLYGNKYSQMISMYKTMLAIESTVFNIKTTNQEIRCQYLLKKIDDGSFKTKLFANYKRTEYLREIENLKQVAYTLLVEWWRSLLAFVHHYYKKYDLRYPDETEENFNSRTQYPDEARFLTSQNREHRVERLYEESSFMVPKFKGVYLVDISKMKNKTRPAEILNFFNNESKKLAEIYGYKTTFSFEKDLYSSHFLIQETNLTKIDTNIELSWL